MKKYIPQLANLKWHLPHPPAGWSILCDHRQQLWPFADEDWDQCLWSRIQDSAASQWPFSAQLQSTCGKQPIKYSMYSVRTRLFWYSVHPDLHSADRCADLDVLRTKLKCRNRQNREQRYRVVGTATEQYKVVWYYSMVRSGTYWWKTVPTEYKHGITNVSQVCTDMHYVCTWYVLGSYWNLMVRTRKNKK